MNCPVCRTDNDYGTRYCVRCGRELADLWESDYSVNDNNSSQMVSADLFSGGEETDLGVHEKMTVADIFSDDFSDGSDFLFDFDGFSESSDIDINTDVDEQTTVADIFKEDDTNSPNNSYTPPDQPPGYASPYENASPYISNTCVSRVYGSQSIGSLPQPQIIGYYPDGTAIYGLPVYPQSQPIAQNISHHVSRPVSQPLNPAMTSAEKAENEKFRQFIDDGKTKEKHDVDFFGDKDEKKDMITARLEEIEARKREAKKKRKDYMGDTPLVNADKLAKNDASKFNKMYMKKTETVNAENLVEKKSTEPNNIMRMTKSVDADRLNSNVKYKSRIRMGNAEDAQTDTFNTTEVKHRKTFMAEAKHAVEAMPKKKKYVDELDLIELPEYMQARKTKKKDDSDIPELPEI